jgi:hypothetical protein
MEFFALLKKNKMLSVIVIGLVVAGFTDAIVRKAKSQQRA